MKVLLFIPATLFVSVALVPLMKMRGKEQETEDKRSMLMDIKLRVTEDVLEEYKTELVGLDDLIKQKKRQMDEMQADVDPTQRKRDEMKTEAEVCAGLQKSARDELAVVETEFNRLQASVEKEMEKEKAEWTKEVAALKSRLAAQSLVCKFVRKDAQGVSAFCKQEEPKAEARKQEEPKAVAPKQEEPKAEAQKQQEPKAEAQKQEEPKAEAQKQQEPKAEAQKQEEPKAEAPKQ